MFCQSCFKIFELMILEIGQCKDKGKEVIESREWPTTCFSRYIDHKKERNDKKDDDSPMLT